MLVFALVASLLLAPAVFAQESDQTATQTDEAADLVRIEIRNRSDQPVTIVLTTGSFAAADQAAGGEGSQVSLEEESSAAQRLGLTVGVESGQPRFFGLAVGPNTDRVFTVERGVYNHRTTACGETLDGVVDARIQLRLIFVPCGQEPANAGEPTMEKIFLSEGEPSNSKWTYAFD
jgi:hypothetical protein